MASKFSSEMHLVINQFEGQDLFCMNDVITAFLQVAAKVAARCSPQRLLVYIIPLCFVLCEQHLSLYSLNHAYGIEKLKLDLPQISSRPPLS